MMKCAKRVAAILLALVLLIGTCVSGLVIPAAAESVNLISNGDFEGFGEASPVYAPWAAYEASKNSTKATVKYGVGVGGSWGLEVSAASGACYTSFPTQITFEEGKTYRLSFMAKGATVAGNAAQVQVYKTTNLTYINNSSKSVYLRPGKTTDEWMSYYTEFTAGAGASWDKSYSLLVNRGSDTGNIVFDNFVLEEVTNESERVSNGDFEKAYDRMFYESIRDGKMEPAIKATETNANNKAMKLLATEAGWDSAWMKNLHLPKGCSYNISFDYIGGAFGMYAANHGEFAGGKELLSFSATDTWTRKQVTLDFFADGSNDWAFSFLKRSSSKQNVEDTYIDNLSITKLPEATGMELDKTAVEMELGTETTLKAVFTPAGASSKAVTWTSSDETVATVVDGKVTSRAVGSATITATAGDFTATCEVTIVSSAEWDTNNDGVLAIMGIGNSFSVDAYRYAYDIARSLGISKVVLGNLYIGSATLSAHATNATTNNAAYTLYWNDNGQWATTSGASIGDTLAKYDWDFVTLQQQSGTSGVASTYNEDLTTLIDYVDERTDARLVWHMTWAYQQDSTHSDFSKYNKDQMTMYNAIVAATQEKILPNDVFEYIIPSGTAVQNARTSTLGDTLTRDGYHMSDPLGRYVTGLTLIKTLTGMDISNIVYAPSGVDDKNKQIAIESANNAVATPFAVTNSAHINEYTLADMEGHYKTQGRIHKTSSRLYLDWSASGFEFKANCSGDVYVNFQVESIDATYGCYFTILVDGVDQGRAFCHITQNGTQKIKIASNLPAGEHRFEIYRQSTMGSTVSINGVFLNGTLSDAPANNELYIEFIGDSITVAQGNLWNSSIESTSNPLVTNATQGYAYITAHDKLGADFATVAVSGIGASVGWTNYNMQQVYPKLRYQKDTTTEYDFARQPDIVVLALGTNDMNRREYHGKTLEDIKQGFKDMLALVREKNPNAKVIWIHGMMLSSASSIIQEVVAEAGGADAGVYELRLTQNNKGGNGHPDADAHVSYANDLSAYINEILAPSAPSETEIQLDKTAAELNVGDTLTLGVTVKPENAEMPTITWTSSNSAVATVENGKVTAVKAGTATITATAGALVATCVVTVKPVKATAIELDKTSVQMDVGDVTTLKATFKPAGAEEQTITWTSSNSAVATVENGKVTAVKAGTATITATAGALVATCVVTAKPVKATAIELDKTSVQMEVGDVTTLKATFKPAGAEEQAITWTSSNEAVVKVVGGKLTAQKIGIAVVTATAGSMKATCAVSVVAPEFSIPEMEGYYKTQGRVYYSDDRLFVDWTASGMEFSANCAGDVYVTFQVDSITSGELEGCYFTVYVDGKEQNRATCHFTEKGTQRVKIASALPAGEHRFEIYRQTQIGNKISINSVTLDGKLLAAPKKSDLSIEFIGDSITTGSGNLATSSTASSGSAYYSNGTKTYAYMAAHDKLDADFSMVAISGIGASVGWTNYNMQQVYPKQRYVVDQNLAYDFAQQPDLVVLALGTNDINRREYYGKTTAEIKQGFKDMLALVREKNPNAKILWIHGMMVYGSSTLIEEVMTEAGGEQAGYYTLQMMQCNSGGNGHPDLSGHMEYANTLAAYIKKIMAPAAPTVSSKTDTKVVLESVKGYEYSRDGKEWQTSTTFSGLSAGTYSFYQRKAETASEKAGLASAALKVPVTGHEYANACDKTCNHCGATRTTSHSYQKVVAKATLSANGKIVNKCKVCGYTASTTTTIYRPYTFKLSATSYTYNGAVKTPTVTVKDSAGKTISSSNYTVTYASGRKNAGTYTVKVAMKGNYSGTKTLSFKINPIDISKCSATLSATSYTYNGAVKTPTVTVKNANGTKLTKDTHYTVTYASGRKNAGTYTVKVTMKGNYSGTKTLSFKINPINISKCKLSLSATTYTYDGKVKAPTVTVKNASGTKLTKDTHYTVTYASGRKNVGTYKVTIKMKGNYTGSKTLTFKINPAKTTVSKITPATKSLKVAITKKSTQVTGYQVQYSTSKSFKSYKTVTISSYKTTSTTLKSLKAKTTYYVRVRTYKTVNGVKYYSGWSTVKYAKTK